MSVVMVVTSLNNVFVDAWLETLEAAVGRVAILWVDSSDSARAVPDSLSHVVTRVSPSSDGSEAKRRVEKLLDGPPSAIFHWWGLQSVSERSAIQMWAGTPEYLCVDTFPNASRPLTELRERFSHMRRLSRLQGIVTASPEMSSSVREAIPALRSTPAIDVLSPFPLRSHASAESVHDFQRRRVCFTGRSDFLYRATAKMGKDDLGVLITELVATGFEVDVQEPRDAAIRKRLLSLGVGFYPRVSRAALMDGTFASLIASYEANLCAYNVVNGTIARRVSAGLSTRFASALGAPSLVVVNDEATFARNLFNLHPIGTHFADYLRGNSDDSIKQGREYWQANHETWTGESEARRLARFLWAG
ncbi:hypothetical protein J2X03_002825 [Microbacterium trichothecenolyticum]|uniref:hypothetical protein n=1 Tax=Microbacterium trichothecenolyticum TaxID=69370 RepID=UPI00286741DA|nr:hypothetical protein [Microbacterium trichothecenolyticum]MDR7112928.1 hypothetical protein [Microbacterium trichothecenolyticum]